MQFKEKDIIKESSEAAIEASIRGRFMMMACDVEYSLLRIMTNCSPDPLNQIRRFNSEEMGMHNKIEATICDLKKYKADYYKEYKNRLATLWEFKIIRNDLAHYKMTIDKNADPILFNLWLISDDVNGKDKLHYKPYTADYLEISLNKFRQLNIDMEELADRLLADIENGINNSS